MLRGKSECGIEDGIIAGVPKLNYTFKILSEPFFSFIDYFLLNL